jgi:hypothetical protein
LIEAAILHPSGVQKPLVRSFPVVSHAFAALTLRETTGYPP